MTRTRPDTLDAIAALQRLAELFSERRLQLARESGITETLWRVLEEVDDESFMPSMFARRRSCTGQDSQGGSSQEFENSRFSIRFRFSI